MSDCPNLEKLSEYDIIVGEKNPEIHKKQYYTIKAVAARDAWLADKTIDADGCCMSCGILLATEKGFRNCKCELGKARRVLRGKE